MHVTTSWLHLLLPAWGLLAAALMQAQTVEPISTDRPDQSDGVYTVPGGVFQLENGVNIAEDLLVNDLMVRYGLGKRTEARVVLDAGGVSGETGLLPVVFSVKQRVLDGRGARPSVALVGYAGFGSLATGDLREEGISTELKLAFEHELADRWALGYNLGTNDPFRNLNVTGNLGWSASDRTAVFVEYFATFGPEPPAHNVDAGVLFALAPVLQLDMAGGRSLVAEEDRAFFTLGISYRFDRTVRAGG